MHAHVAHFHYKKQSATIFMTELMTTSTIVQVLEIYSPLRDAACIFYFTPTRPLHIDTSCVALTYLFHFVLLKMHI
jgi:hypothetical protein